MQGDYFPGLLPLVQAYLEHIRCDPAIVTKVNKYLDLVARRARGEIPTTARWIRNFVTSHPDYQRDSVVPPSTAFDLLERCRAIGDGSVRAPELLSEDVFVKPITAGSAYEVPLTAARLGTSESRELIQSYLQRSSLRKMTPKVVAAAGTPECK